MNTSFKLLPVFVCLSSSLAFGSGGFFQAKIVPASEAPNTQLAAKPKNGTLNEVTQSLPVSFCNSSATPFINVAVGYWKDEGRGKGWWVLSPGQCVVVLTDIADNVYAYAESDTKDKFWSGNVRICVHTSEVFDVPNSVCEGAPADSSFQFRLFNYVADLSQFQSYKYEFKN